LLITGCNGLIGRIIWPDLADTYDLIGLDRSDSNFTPFHKVDISRFEPLGKLLQELKPLPYVVHLAAASKPSATWDQVLDANIIGTRNVLEAARLAGVKRIVIASSNHVTGAYEGFEPDLHLHLEPEPELISTLSPIRPDSDYGVSKAFTEAAARYYTARWGLEAVCLRIGSVLEDDNPGANPRHMKTWLSHRDLRQLIRLSLTASVPFGIYYGVSNNTGRFWDTSNARAEIGYAPQDDASAFPPM